MTISVTAVASRRVRTALVAAAVVSLAATAASAQRLQRPIFGERNQGQEELLLMLTTSASSQDRDETPTLDGFDVPNAGSRFYGDVNGGMSYTPRPMGPFTLSLNANSAVRRYETGDAFMVLGHSAGGSLRWAAARRTTLSGFAGFSYRPSYTLRWDLTGDAEELARETGTLPPEAVDFSLGKRIARGTNGGGSVTQTLTRRVSLTASYRDRLERFYNEAYRSQQEREAHGRINVGIARGMSLRLGYGRRVADTEGPRGARRTAIDDIDVGIDMARALSLTRTTTVSFSSGTFIAEQEGVREANVMGQLAVNQQIGRTGALSFQAFRRVEIQDGFVQPVLSNGASLIGSYQPAQRWFFSVAAIAAKGRTLERRASTAIENYSGFARLGYQFMRNGQLFAQYLVSNHDIGNDVEIIGLVAREQMRKTVRVGVSWSVPLLTDRDRPVAPRGPAAPATTP